MKIVLMISALSRGGAEQQLIRLASGLVESGIQVQVWCYGGPSSEDQVLEESGVVVRVADSRGQLAKLARVRAWLDDFKPDVVHAFMKRASSLALMARLGKSVPVVIGSDMSTATYNRSEPALWIALVLFALADAVVTQTALNQRSLHLLAPWLRRKTRVVRNGLDLSRFKPKARTTSSEIFRFVSVGSVYSVKNPLRLIAALIILRERGRTNLRVDWYGRLGLSGDETPSDDYRRCVRLIAAEGLGAMIHFHGERTDIHYAYSDADAIIHPSVQEGFPNAVIEGMACGLPIVVGQVSDLPLVVETANNGFVFNETDPDSIADAMEAMMKISLDVRHEMGQRSRDLVEQWFSKERFVDEFRALYSELLYKQ